MELQVRLIRRTLIGLTLTAVLMLAFGVFNPYSDISLAVRLILVAVASILVAGIIPGSYIHQFVDFLTSRPELGSRRIITISAIFGPLILVAFAALGVYSQIDTLQFIDEMNIDFLDAREARFNALRFATVGIVSFILFLWNAVYWVRGRNVVQTT